MSHYRKYRPADSFDSYTDAEDGTYDESTYSTTLDSDSHDPSTSSSFVSENSDTYEYANRGGGGGRHHTRMRDEYGHRRHRSRSRGRRFDDHVDSLGYRFDERRSRSRRRRRDPYDELEEEEYYWPDGFEGGGEDMYMDEEGEEEGGEGGEYEDEFDLPPAMQIHSVSYEQYRNFVDRMAFTMQSFIMSSLKYQESVLLATPSFMPAGATTRMSQGERALHARAQAILKLASSISSMQPAMKQKFGAEIARYIDNANISSIFMNALRYSAAVTYSTSDTFLQIPADVSCGKHYYSYTLAIDGNGEAQGAWHNQRTHPLMNRNRYTPAASTVISLEDFAFDCINQFVNDYVSAKIVEYSGINNQLSGSNGRALQYGKLQQTQKADSATVPVVVLDMFADIDALSKTLSIVVESVLERYAKAYTSQVPSMQEIMQTAAGGGLSSLAKVSTAAFLGLETNKQHSERRVADLVNSQLRELAIQTQDTIHTLQSDMRHRDRRLRRRMEEQRRHDRKRAKRNTANGALNYQQNPYQQLPHNEQYNQGPMATGDPAAYLPSDQNGGGYGYNNANNMQQQQPFMPMPRDWFYHYYQPYMQGRQGGSSGRRKSSSSRRPRRGRDDRRDRRAHDYSRDDDRHHRQSRRDDPHYGRRDRYGRDRRGGYGDSVERSIDDRYYDRNYETHDRYSSRAPGSSHRRHSDYHHHHHDEQRSSGRRRRPTHDDSFSDYTALM